MPTFIYLDKFYRVTYFENKYLIRRTFDKRGNCITNSFKIWGRNKRGFTWIVFKPEDLLKEQLLNKCTD